MTDPTPTPTRAEVERIPEHCAWAARGYWGSAYMALLEDHKALRERAEAAEAERAEQWRQRRGAEAARDTALAISDAAQRAETAAWNDAIEAAAEKCDVVFMDHVGDLIRAIGDDIRALRRAAPTEGEA